MKLPNTVEELLQFLDRIIPEPSPRPGDSAADIMWNAGRRSVVMELHQLRAGSVPKALREKRGEGRVVPSRS